MHQCTREGATRGTAHVASLQHSRSHPTVGRCPREGAAIPSVTAYKYPAGLTPGLGGCPVPGHALFLARKGWHFPPCRLQPGLGSPAGRCAAHPGCPHPQGPPSSPPQPCRTPSPPPRSRAGGCCLLTAALGSMSRCCSSRASCQQPWRHRLSSWHSGAPRTLARAQTPPEAPGDVRAGWQRAPGSRCPSPRCGAPR